MIKSKSSDGITPVFLCPPLPEGIGAMCIFGLFLSKSMQKRKQNQQKTHKMMRKPIKFCIFVIFLAKNTEKRIQQQRNTYKIQRKPSNSASFVCFLVKKHVKRRQIQQNTRQNAEKTKKSSVRRKQARTFT